MKVDRTVVLGIAKLAKIELNDSEVELFVKQLGDVLEYVEKLNEVAEPETLLPFCEFLQSVTRPDENTASLTVEEALQNAPARSGNFFKVPRIIP